MNDGRVADRAAHCVEQVTWNGSGICIVAHLKLTRSQDAVGQEHVRANISCADKPRSLAVINNVLRSCAAVTFICKSADRGHPHPAVLEERFVLEVLRAVI